MQRKLLALQKFEFFIHMRKKSFAAKEITSFVILPSLIQDFSYNTFLQR